MQRQFPGPFHYGTKRNYPSILYHSSINSVPPFLKRKGGMEDGSHVLVWLRRDLLCEAPIHLYDSRGLPA